MRSAIRRKTKPLDRCGHARWISLRIQKTADTKAKLWLRLVRLAALVKLSSNRRPRGVVRRKRAKAARIPRVPGERQKLVTPHPKSQPHEAEQCPWREMHLPRELHVRRCIARSIHPLRGCSVVAQRIPRCCRMGEISGDLRPPLRLMPLTLLAALLASATQAWHPMQLL
jgi:hypothetical protein